MKLIDAAGAAILAALSLGAFYQQQANAERIKIFPWVDLTVKRPPIDGVMVLPPPKRFDHPYKGVLTEYYMELAMTRKLCKKQGVEADSCSWVSGKRCFIVYPWDGPVKDREQYRRHEIAHCNGWGANHEK